MGSWIRRVLACVLCVATLPLALPHTPVWADSAWCAAPGRDGAATLTGIINTYYPPATTGDTTSASTSLALGAPAPTGVPALAPGDLVLIIQMQGAEITSIDSSSYGDGISGVPASGLIGTPTAGQYTYVRAGPTSNATTLDLTATPIPAGMIFTQSPASSTQGHQRFQVIRIPQYSRVQLGAGGIQALTWDGTTGGVLALDVAGSLAMNGQTISVAATGFRGGGAVSDGHESIPAVMRPSTSQDGSKGEGIAGTPRFVWDSTFRNTGEDGYPGGSDSQGAPANAGGGGTQIATGGGGGANIGTGGVGGLHNGTGGNAYGGYGGVGRPATILQVIAGGGGGAGSANDGLPDARASGGTGGGILLLRAGSWQGTGTLTARGGDSVTNPNIDPAGGAGGGGTIVALTTQSTGWSTITVDVRGGTGGSAALTATNDPHGPGGGGGGGAAFLNGVPAAASSAAGGAAGITQVNGGGFGPFGATPGSAGTLSSSTTSSSMPNAVGGGTCLPVLTVTKTTSTPNLPQNSTGTYTLTVTNTGGTASAVTLTDTLPTGFTFTGTASAVLTGGATGTTAPPNSGSSSVPAFAGYTMPQGSQVQITFSVAIGPVPGGTYQNTAAVTMDDPARTSAGQRATPGQTLESGAVMPGSNYASASSTNEDITITAVNQPPIAQDRTNTVILSSAGTSVLNPGMLATDSDGPIAFYRITSLPQATEAVLYQPDGVTLLAVGDLLIPADAAGVQVDPVSTFVGTAQFTYTARDQFGAEDLTDATYRIPIGLVADITVTKNGAASAPAGSIVTYTIIVRNQGPQSAAQVAVTDTLPAGVTVVNAGGGVVTGNTINFTTIPTLAASTQVIYTVDLRMPNEPTTLTNQAQATSTTADPTPANNDGTASASQAQTQVTARADLVLAKQASPANATLGDTLTYNLRITNNGPSTATGITVVDTLPVGVTFTSAAPGCTHSAGIVTCTLATLASATTSTMAIVVQVTTAAPITNVAEITTSNQPDPTSTPGNGTSNGEDDTARVTTPQQQADLSFTMITHPSAVVIGQSTVLRLTVKNDGPSDATNVITRVTLPASLSFAGTDNGCIASGQVMNCTAIQISRGGEAGFIFFVRVRMEGSHLITGEIVASNQDDPDSVPNTGTTNGEDDTARASVVGLQVPINGNVFADSNANGILDTTETIGIGGVLLTLTGTDVGGSAVSLTQATSSAGSYQFMVAPGTYTIDQQQPVAYGSTSPNSRTIVVTDAGRSGVNFGESVSSLHGRMCEDINGDQICTPTDTGIAGVRVALVGVDAAGTLYTGQTVTAADGTYAFAFLGSGTYQITAARASGYQDQPDEIGSAGGTRSPPNSIRTIALAIATDATGYHFPERAPATINGTMFRDSNRDGVIDPAEGGIGGLRITLFTSSGSTVGSTVTDGDGLYQFYDLTPGMYEIRFDPNDPVLPANTAITTGNPATPITVQAGVQHRMQAVGFGIAPTAVVLSQFAAHATATASVVAWTTGSEQSTFGFILVRLLPDGTTAQVGGIILATGTPTTYTVQDSPQPAGTRYTLNEITTTGVRTALGTVLMRPTRTNQYIPLLLRAP